MTGGGVGRHTMAKGCRSILSIGRVYAVQWSLDSEYVLSGSDDMNIRIWKALAAKPLGNVFLL